MGQAKFVLKEPKSKEPTLIYLLYWFNGKRLKYSTGKKILPKYWNKNRQRVKETRNVPHAGKINKLLTSLFRGVSDSHTDLINDNKLPSIFKLKNELDKLIFKNEYSNPEGFLSFVDKFIEQANIKAATKRQWTHTLKKLKEFQNAKGYEVDFDTINLDFYNTFIQYLTSEGYASNTIGSYIKRIKIFMNEAVERKLTTNVEYRNRKFKVLEEQVDKIYLDQAELNTIYRLDLSQNPRLEKVRDLFIIGSYTGLRFSDLIKLTKQNFTGNNDQLKIKTEKTNQLVVIPLHKYVKEILAKYNGNIPEPVSNQKMNDYLKEIAEKAELDSSIKIGITKAGKLQHNTYKKHELVSTHTARRSFATNAYLNNVPTISIMKITGHKTEKAFMRYIRISQEENANKLATHPFFKS